MLAPAVLTWILLVFGFVTPAPLLGAQLTILLKPEGHAAKDIPIGRGEDRRDRTHFKSALGMAWADWLLAAALLLAGSYPSRGPLAYCTYYWGFFVVWGAAALAYSTLRLSGLMI